MIKTRNSEKEQAVIPSVNIMWYFNHFQWTEMVTFQPKGSL